MMSILRADLLVPQSYCTMLRVTEMVTETHFVVPFSVVTSIKEPDFGRFFPSAQANNA